MKPHTTDTPTLKNAVFALVLEKCFPARADIYSTHKTIYIQHIQQHVIALACLSVQQIIMMNWKTHNRNGFNIDNWSKDLISCQMDLLSMERATSVLNELDRGDEGP